MSSTSSNQPAKNYEIPCVWHTLPDLDLSQGRDLANIPSGGFERAEVWHGITELDGSPIKLQLTLTYDSQTVSLEMLRDDVESVVQAVRAAEVRLGGKGFTRETLDATEAAGRLTIVLIPLARRGVEERLRQLVSELRSENPALGQIALDILPNPPAPA